MPTITFSSSVISLKMRMFWNVRAMPLRVIWCGLRPSSVAPSSVMSPVVGGSRPVIRLNTVVLPAPFGPIRPEIVPGRTAKETSCSTFRPPKWRDTLVSVEELAHGVTPFLRRPSSRRIHAGFHSPLGRNSTITTRIRPLATAR